MSEATSVRRPSGQPRRGPGGGFTRLLAIGSRYGALAAQFLVVVSVARVLSKAESGIYLLVFSAVTTTIVFVGFGAPDGLVKAVPELLHRGELGAARREVLKNAVLTARLGAVLLAVLCAIAILTGHEWRVVIAFAAWWIPYAILFFSGQSLVALGRSAIGTFVFYTLNNLVTIVVLLPYLYLSGDPSALGALHVSIIAGWGAALLGIYFVHSALPAEVYVGDGVQSPETLRLGFLIALARVFQSALYWVPAWVCAWMLGAADAAVMGAAGRLLIAATAVLAVFRFTIRPRIVAAELQGDRVAIAAMSRLAATISLAFILFCGLFVLVFGKVVISLVFGAGYAAAASVLSILFIGALGESMGGPVDEVLKYLGHAKFVLFGLVVTVAIEFLIAFIFANEFGTIQAIAMAQSLAFCGMYAAQVAYCYRKNRILILPFVSWHAAISAARQGGF